MSKNEFDFTGKVCLVTGASSGMGLATAQAFAEACAAVVLADVSQDLLKTEVQKLITAGHKAIAVRCDVSNEEQVAAMVEHTVSEFGRLDAAFNNAGVMVPAVETADATGADFDRLTGINLKGVWNCLKYELLQMRKQESGAIVNNSSIGGLVGVPGRAIYHATKHGVLGLTKSAALEYAARGIRINAVCPGTINTPMVQEMLAKEPEAMQEILRNQPNKRIGEPGEIASAVLWLCSPGASFVIGHALVVDGGYTIQ
jgi:NAD(P)-dependent dehydrogenase (short-subunit alcohol dehydrogenase family)